MTSKPQQYAWLPLAVLFPLIGWLAADGSDRVYDYPSVLVGLNYFFVLPVSLLVAILAGRSFLRQGDPGLLWFGSAAVIWGCSGAVGSTLISINAPIGITAHNLLVTMSAVGHLTGVLLSIGGRRTVSKPRIRQPVFAYLAALAISSLVTGGAMAKLTPVFFVTGSGGTPIRQFALVSALLMFAVTATLLLRKSRDQGRGFVFWYGLAMVSVTLGLTAILIQPSAGSAINWVGRLAQVLGSGYMLVATLATAHLARYRGQSVELALREAEQRFDDIMDMAPDGILVHERVTESNPGHFIRANPAVCALLGYSAGEMAHKGPLDVMAPHNGRAVAGEGEALARDGYLRHQKDLISRNGERIPVEISSRLFQKDGRQLIVSVVHDLRSRLLVEQQQAQLAAIVESSFDAIVGMTMAGTITSWNGAAQRIFGYRPEEVLGQPVSILAAPGLRPGGPDLSAEMASSQLLKELDTIRLHKDGAPIPVSVTISPIRDGSGAIVGASMIVRDISARKRMENELRSFNASLEQMVVDRTAALQKAHDLLEERVAERTEAVRRLAAEATYAEERERQALARDLHDDLGQLLHVARIKLDLLGKIDLPGTGKSLLEEMRTLLGDASHQVRSLTSQLNPPILSTLGLPAALWWLCGELKETYGLSVSCQTDISHCSLTADQSAILFRAARELLINVAKHSGESTASLHLVRQGETLIMTVADAGHGVESIEETLAGARGFGLASIRERISFLGGTMDLETPATSGMRVVLRMPLDASREENKAEMEKARIDGASSRL